MKLWLKAYLVTCLSLIVTCLLVMGYWAFRPYNVLTTYTDKMPILTPRVKAGEALRWQVDVYHHTTGVNVEITRQIQDGMLLNFPTVGYTTQEGRQTFENQLRVPDYADAGMYKLVVTSVFKVNPLRDIVIVRESDYFEVYK